MVFLKFRTSHSVKCFEWFRGILKPKNIALDNYIQNIKLLMVIYLITLPYDNIYNKIEVWIISKMKQKWENKIDENEI